MEIFISRILKAKLIALFAITLTSLVAFYFSGRMPDHYISISSENPHINYFSYYATSLIALVGRYSGPWIFFPFVGYALFYTFIYSRRKSSYDIFNGFSMSLFFLSMAYIFFPTSLGDGIGYLLHSYLSLGTAIALGTSFLLLLAWGTFPTAIGQGLIWAILQMGRTKGKDAPVALKNPPKEKKDATSTLAPPSKAINGKDPQYNKIIATIPRVRALAKAAPPSPSYFKVLAQRIEDKLAEFSIQGKIINILKGPVVDTFELQLGSGVKVSRVTATEDDLSVALLGSPIRMIYPMAGRSTMGIEVPRVPREIIQFGEILDSQEFTSFQGELPISMGKDAFGEIFMADLAAMPHMLVAGSTGTGKSVFINALLLSLLHKCSPRQIQLILIDPKQLELSFYRKLPHLVAPVLQDIKETRTVLNWAISEMERRYSLLEGKEVRNITLYNQRVATEAKLPYLVIVVDEFADLILAHTGKEIENSICRLAAKARAAGIHLVVATQRPSVDVITGLIKSNFPTRVSFKVTSAIDSRTILTEAGAEKLLGKGDMLYRYGSICKRIHSPLVREEDINALVGKIGVLGQKFNPQVVKMLSSQRRPPSSEAKFPPRNPPRENPL